jgi:transposase
MPKKVEALVLGEEDARTLEAISSGATMAGDEVRRRADVLLDQAAGLSVRATARKRGVRTNTVTEIRRRWDKLGVESLEDAPRSGRRHKGGTPEEVEASADAFVAEWREAHGGQDPTVAEASEGMGCSRDQARDALERRGIVKPRGRAWSFPTDQDTRAHAVELAGIYLSASQQVVAVLVGEPDGAPAGGAGSLSTMSPALARELGREAADGGLVGLADALEAAASVRTRGGGRRDSGALAFARALLPGVGGGTLHLLACGDPVLPAGGSALIGAEVEEVATLRGWASSVESLLRVLCPGDAPLAARLASSIMSFLRGAGPTTEPFRWSRARGADGAAVAAAAADHPAPGTVEATIRVAVGDGEWVEYKATVASGVTPEEFGTTPGGYAASAGLISQAVIAAGRDAERGATQAFLASVVKKTS